MSDRAYRRFAVALWVALLAITAAQAANLHSYSGDNTGVCGAGWCLEFRMDWSAPVNSFAIFREFDN